MKPVEIVQYPVSGPVENNRTVIATLKAVNNFIEMRSFAGAAAMT